MGNAELANWDPLEENIAPELLSASVKRQIKNILKSYTGWFDPLSELLQNAIDALEQRRKTDHVFTPSLWVTIDLAKNHVSVTDNGSGFSQDEFRSFLAPNISFKKATNRGNKGVGATYLAYGFNLLQVATRTPGFEFIGSIKQGREWVEDESGTVTRPKVVRDPVALASAFSTLDHGSSFTLGLGGELVRPRDLRWLQATTASQWESVLRLKTPLGGVYLNRDPFLLTCHLSVVAENGTETKKEVDCAEYLYPHKVFTACKDLDAIRKIQSGLVQQGKDASRLPAAFYNLNGLYKFWSPTEIADVEGEFKSGRQDGALTITDEDRKLIERYQVACYGFMGYSTDLWDLFNDTQVGLRKGKRILLRGGLQLATNAMPQGDLIQIPLNRNIGYQNVAHVLVHFDGADPDLGRKGFQPELQEAAKKISVAVANIFLQWRRQLRGDTGAPPEITSSRDIYDWVTAQERFEKENPLVIRRTDYFLPTAEPSLTSIPQNEQDVIALFHQLLAGGVIRGVRVLSTSQHNQYDGVFRFSLKFPADHHVFDKDRNPLGIDESHGRDEFLSEPRILEYKFSVDGLVEELERGDKVEKDIKLVIAWSMGRTWGSRYIITPLLSLDNVHQRVFHGGTHLVRNALTGDTVFPAIILSELIEYLNDVDGVQKFQAETYSG
jgi:hypothetical protein